MNEYETDTWFDHVMRASTSQSYHQVTNSSLFCELRCVSIDRLFCECVFKMDYMRQTFLLMTYLSFMAAKSTIAEATRRDGPDNEDTERCIAE